ncbi:hypothetical protein L1987_57470 [Smallanthus sonchifolius]|uniref:Uncharacterized protein n=1 Tax=Smallanthus sonchifolius TaxID=185202 RepID=A0ACB9DCW5_9ASTR|nr:hypothetical protein L1987_57470 [Smallanthus sonchifolius]
MHFTSNAVYINDSKCSHNHAVNKPAAGHNQAVNKPAAGHNQAVNKPTAGTTATSIPELIENSWDIQQGGNRRG